MRPAAGLVRGGMSDVRFGTADRPALPHVEGRTEKPRFHAGGNGIVFLLRHVGPSHAGGSGKDAEQEVSEGFFIELSETEIAINGELATVEILKNKSAAVQNKKAPVALKIDKKTPYEKVAEVLDVLQMEKIYNIQFVNELKKE